MRPADVTSLRNWPVKCPVLLVIFRRPETTKLVFEAVRSARPPILFVAADGPRNRDDEEPCQAARRITEEVDWPCDVYRDYSPTNLGCGPRPSSAISWTLGQVDRTIILEDDCVPSLSFFRFCDALLERFRDDTRVMSIDGGNYLGDGRRLPYSYAFSRLFCPWGWATWRRSWAHFDRTMSGWAEAKSQRLLADIARSEFEVRDWTRFMDKYEHTEAHVWDFQWLLSCMLQSGLTVFPDRNLVTNLGGGPSATHTNVLASPLLSAPACDMDEIRHPAFVVRDCQADAYLYDHVFGGKHRRSHASLLGKGVLAARAVLQPRWAVSRIRSHLARPGAAI